MGVLNIFNTKTPVAVAGRKGNVPLEMQFHILPDKSVIWTHVDQETLLKKGYMGNHAVFTVMHWIGKKVASAPWILYKIKDEKAYDHYKALLKDATPLSVKNAKLIKSKALIEVDNKDIIKLFKKPNQMMSWFEFAYGTYIYKAAVGSSYWSAVRSGSVNDDTKGKIKELWLPPAHHMRIESGGIYNPISKYFLSTNPETKIDARNVHQMRNFSPDYTTDTAHLYGMSQLTPLKEIIQKHNESIISEIDLSAKKGVRDIVFLKKDQESMDYTYDQFQKIRDKWESKMADTKSGGIMINSKEVGSIRVGFSPQEMGILESNKVTKSDFCAAFHVHPIIFSWNEQTTFNNMSEARKMSFVDAVLPELEVFKDGLNDFVLPSYDDSGKYTLEYNLDYFPEMQDDNQEKVKWLKEIPLTSDEFRDAFGYESKPSENSDKVLVNSGKRLLDDMGIEGVGPSGGDEEDPDLLDNNKKD